MAERESRPRCQARPRWIGLAALGWIALLAVAWLWFYSDAPPVRWAGAAGLARELALLAFLLGAAYGWGRLALLRWHTPPGERPESIWAFGLGFGVLWLATFAVAALHRLGPAWPWLLLGGGWLALLATLRPRPHPRLPNVADWTVAEWFLLGVMVCCLGYSLLAWALAPPLAWDEVSYHLPIPQTYIAAGGFVNIPTIVHSNWPAGMELLNTLALLLGSELLPHLTVLAMVVLTALELARFARQHFTRRTAWLAATLYLAMPMVKFLAGVALIEGALGFFGFLAVWTGYLWLENRRWRDLILAGLMGGLAASIKLTGAAVPMAVGAVGLAWLLLRRRGEWGRSQGQFVAYGGIALAVVAPWYVKSAIYTGNPVWPFLYGLFGGRNWDAVGDQIHTAWLHRPNLAPTVWHYLGGLWYLVVRWGDFGGMSLGAAILALLPLSLLFWRRKPWLRGYLFGVSAAVYSIWFLTTHQTRFLMGIVPALALLAAYAFDRLLAAWPAWLGAVGRVALAFYFVVGLPFANADQWQRIAERWPYVAGQVTRETFLSQQVEGYEAFAWANEHLPPDARVLLAVWETRGYYLERESVWANPLSQRVIRWEQVDNAGELADQLRALGISHVFWNHEQVIEDVADGEHADWLLGALLDEYGQPVYDQDGITIYCVR